MFHFWTAECFWSFQDVKNKVLVRYGLRTYLMLLRHCRPMCYILPPVNLGKPYCFLTFSGGKTLDIDLTWNKSVTVVNFNCHEHSSIYGCNVHWYTGIHGLWTQELDVGLWTLDPGRWNLDSGRWTLDAGLWTLNPGRWTLDSGLRTLNARLGMLKLQNLKLSKAFETVDP